MRVKVKVDNGWCWVYNGGMKIEFGLMGIISTCVAAALVLCGSYASIPGGSIDFYMSSGNLSISVNPVVHFLTDIDILTRAGCYGFCFGNVIATPKEWDGEIEGDCIVAHELVHIKQYRALGLAIIPLSFILPIENEESLRVWNNPETFTNGMYHAPTSLSSFNFISITICER